MRLEKYVGNTMVVINSSHEFYHCVVVGRSFEEMDSGNFGLVVDYNEESTFITSASEVMVIDPKEKLTVEETIEKLAGCNYGPRDIAKYLDLPFKEFLAAWKDKESVIRYHYERGRLVADFEVNEKLLDNAKSGNITAAQIYFKSAEEKKVESLKEEIFYGFET